MNEQAAPTLIVAVNKIARQIDQNIADEIFVHIHYSLISAANLLPGSF